MCSGAWEYLKAGRTIIGFELLFQYEDGDHYAGVKYDKKSAKKAQGKELSPEYLYVYLDKDSYSGTEELFANAKIGGVPLNEIASGILVFQDEIDFFSQQTKGAFEENPKNSEK